MTACFVNLPGFLQMRSNEWFSYIVIKDTPVFLLKLPFVHSTLHIIIRNATIHAFLSGFNPKFNQYGYCWVRTFGALKNRQFYFLHVPMISNGCIKIRSIYAATLLVVDLSSTVSPRAGDKIYIDIIYNEWRVVMPEGRGADVVMTSWPVVSNKIWIVENTLATYWWSSKWSNKRNDFRMTNCIVFNININNNKKNFFCFPCYFCFIFSSQLKLLPFLCPFSHSISVVYRVLRFAWTKNTFHRHVNYPAEFYSIPFLLSSCLSVCSCSGVSLNRIQLMAWPHTSICLWTNWLN